jgi:hypothetical protein
MRGEAVDDLQRQVQDAVDQLVDSGAERGVQVAVYLRGEQGGAGGTYAFGDTATGVAFALNKNRLTAGFGAAGEVAGIVTKAVTRG